MKKTVRCPKGHLITIFYRRGRGIYDCFVCNAAYAIGDFREGCTWRDTNKYRTMGDIDGATNGGHKAF